MGGIFRNAAAFGAVTVVLVGPALLRPALPQDHSRLDGRRAAGAVRRRRAVAGLLGELAEAGFLVLLSHRAPARWTSRRRGAAPPRVVLLAGSEGEGLTAGSPRGLGPARFGSRWRPGSTPSTSPRRSASRCTGCSGGHGLPVTGQLTISRGSKLLPCHVASCHLTLLRFSPPPPPTTPGTARAKRAIARTSAKLLARPSDTRTAPCSCRRCSVRNSSNVMRRCDRRKHESSSPFDRPSAVSPAPGLQKQPVRSEMRSRLACRSIRR